MSDLPLLSAAQMRRLSPLFPRSRGLRRVDDRRVISGTIYVIRVSAVSLTLYEFAYRSRVLASWMMSRFCPTVRSVQ
jgi:hypothetical protein